MIRASWLVVVLALGGCCAQLGGGGAITPHAPRHPSGDGGFVFSAYRTTFADPDPMWSYGVNFTMAVDPEVLGNVIFRDPR